MAENHNPAEAVACTVIEEKSNSEHENTETKPIEAKPIRIKRLTLPLTIISFLLSLPILFSVIWLIYTRLYDCEDLLIRLPKLQIAIVVGLVIVFLISNLVVYRRERFPVLGHLFVMVPLILMLTVGLGLVGAYKMESRTVPGSPLWIKMKVHNDYNWNNIKSCIYATRTCDDLGSRSYMRKAYDFTKGKLSNIESGCCRPPASCNMQYVNATFWEKNEDEVIDNSTPPYNRDCGLWRNGETMLCYNCDACREGFLKTLQGKWWRIGTFLVVMAVLLIVSHLLLFVATMWERYGG